jgi:hypothetical protein
VLKRRTPSTGYVPENCAVELNVKGTAITVNSSKVGNGGSQKSASPTRFLENKQLKLKSEGNVPSTNTTNLNYE